MYKYKIIQFCGTLQIILLEILQKTPFSKKFNKSRKEKKKKQQNKIKTSIKNKYIQKTKCIIKSQITT